MMGRGERTTLQLVLGSMVAVGALGSDGQERVNSKFALVAERLRRVAEGDDGGQLAGEIARLLDGDTETAELVVRMLSRTAEPTDSSKATHLGELFKAIMNSAAPIDVAVTAQAATRRSDVLASEKRDVVLVEEAAPAVEGPPTPEAVAALERWNRSIVEVIGARIELQAEDPRTAVQMDIALIRFITGSGEVQA